MTNSLLKYKKLSAVIALTLASSTTLAADLGVANNFSAFVFNDFKSNFGRADGAIAAGEIDLKGYSVGYTRPYSPEEYYLISESTIDFKYGRQYVGSMVAGGGTDVHWSVRWGMEWGSKILSNQDESALPFNFDEQEQYYKDLSAQLGELDETGTVYRKWGGLYLQGDGSSDRQVFNVDARDFAKAHTFKVWGIPADATIIFNITGDDNVVVKGKSFARLRHHASKTVFNFTNAQKLDIKGNRWQGVILAPYADIRGVYGTAKMPIIGQSFYGSMALLGGEFAGQLPNTDTRNCGQIYISEKWQWNNSIFQPTYNQVISSPIVVQLNDDNNDGYINNGDVADVVVTTFDLEQWKSPGLVRALSGIDGKELWLNSSEIDSTPSIYTDAKYSISAADIDKDGLIEIVVYNPLSKSVEVYGNDGLLKKSLNISSVSASHLNITDSNDDGDAELVIANKVINLVTGQEVELIKPLDYISNTFKFDLRDSIAFDSNLNGQQEILTNGILYSNDGFPIFNKNTTQGFSAVTDFDGDNYPEIILTDLDGSIKLLDYLGNIKWEYKSQDSGAGVPSVSDVDGDGVPDIVFAGSTKLMALDSNGQLISSFNIDDSSSQRNGVSSYDFNGDGKSEILYNDENSFYIVDMSNGTVIFESLQSSGTLWEYPIVADLTGDKGAEVITVMNSLGLEGGAVLQNGVAVYKSNICDKAEPTRIWNQHSYSGTNIDQNGSLPLQQENSWEKTNTFRSANLK